MGNLLSGVIFSSFTVLMYTRTYTAFSCRCSQNHFSTTHIQTLRIQPASWPGPRRSVGQTTSSSSMGSWGRSTLLCSWYTSVSTTLQLDDHLLKNFCINWKQWGPRPRGHTARAWGFLWILRRWGYSRRRMQRLDTCGNKYSNCRLVASVAELYMYTVRYNICILPCMLVAGRNGG